MAGLEKDGSAPFTDLECVSAFFRCISGAFQLFPRVFAAFYTVYAMKWV